MRKSSRTPAANAPTDAPAPVIPIDHPVKTPPKASVKLSVAIRDIIAADTRRLRELESEHAAIRMAMDRTIRGFLSAVAPNVDAKDNIHINSDGTVVEVYPPKA